MNHAIRPAMSDEALRKKLAAAIFDPGATEGYKGDRTLTEWQTDAVMRALTAPAQPVGVPVTLTYTNWRGETAERTIVPKSVWYGSTDWHPDPQWLLKAIDVEKNAERDFALKDFAAPQPPAEEGCGRRFVLEWIAGARPPVHPAPMRGRQSFTSYDDAISFMRRQAPDAQLASLTEHVTRSVDRSDDARSALPPTPANGGSDDRA